jgi:hypothetical protein
LTAFQYSQLGNPWSEDFANMFDFILRVDQRYNLQETRKQYSSYIVEVAFCVFVEETGILCENHRLNFKMNLWKSNENVKIANILAGVPLNFEAIGFSMSSL